MPRAAKKSVAAPMTSPPPAAKMASQEEDLTALSRKELQQLAKDLGLKANAKNAELIEAIQKAQKPSSKKQQAEPAAAVSAVKAESSAKKTTPAVTPKGRKSTKTAVPSTSRSTRTATNTKSTGKGSKLAKAHVEEEEEEEEEEERPKRGGRKGKAKGEEEETPTPAAPVRSARKKKQAAEAPVEEEEEEEEEAGDALEQLSRAELQAMAKGLGIKANGSSASLVTAIRAHTQQQPESAIRAHTNTQQSVTQSAKPLKAAPPPTTAKANKSKAKKAPATSSTSGSSTVASSASVGKGRRGGRAAASSPPLEETQPEPASGKRAARGKKEVVGKKEEGKGQEEEAPAQRSNVNVEDSPPPVASLSDQRDEDDEAVPTTDMADMEPKGVQEEAAARRRMSLARQRKEDRYKQLGQVKNKLSKAVHAISKSKTRNSPRLDRLTKSKEEGAKKPAMPAREKENLKQRINNERLTQAVKSLQGSLGSHAAHRSPIKSDGVRKAQAERREGFMAGAAKKRESAFDRARQAALQNLQTSADKDN